MVQTRSPGVYMERGAAPHASLSLLPSGVPVFLGVAERGPTNRPIRITSLEEYLEVFGRVPSEIPDTYMASAIDGFFLNGGRECYVTRIAHLFDRSPHDDDRPALLASGDRMDIAIKASVRLRDGTKQNTLLVQALSEGGWGNAIRVSVQRPPATVQTFLTVDGQPEEFGVMVKSTFGFARGSHIKLSDGKQETFRVLTAVEGRMLYWSEREPLDQTFLSSAPTIVEPVGFDLVAETHNAREVFRDLNLARQSPRFAERVINGVSRLITVTDLASASGMPLAFPVEVAARALDGGTDGLWTVRPEDFIGMDNGPGQRFGLWGIAELEEIDLICMPDLPWFVRHGRWTPKEMEVVQQEAVTVCEYRGDRFALLDLPPDLTPSGVMHWRRLFDTSYAAFYYPYVQPLGEQRKVPPCGHVAGVIARCDSQQGVYRAPANEPLDGVVDLDLFLQEGDIATLNAEGVNCLKIFAQRGIRVWGARTASSDPQMRFLNVRRTVLAISRALNSGLQWVVFEPNGESLWHIVERDVSFFLDQLWRTGYLRGDAAEQAYIVRCDDESNTPDTVDDGQVIVDVWIAPFRPTEFIGIRVVQEVEASAEERGA